MIKLALSNEDYVDNEWSNEAKFKFQQLQHEEEKARKPDISRETLLKEIKEDLKRLNNSNGTLNNTGSFIPCS